MDAQKLKHRRQIRRANRVRSKITGTAERPRLTIFRSSKHIYVQLIDDMKGVTLASADTKGKEFRAAHKTGANIAAAADLGKILAEAAKAKNITKVAFDRGHFRYHGRLKAFADAARAGGLEF
jgi:large subunit ribosomal protein L18